MICMDGGRCLIMSMLCCATKLVGDAKLTADVHPSEVESADSFDVFLPVAVADEEAAGESRNRMRKPSVLDSM